MGGRVALPGGRQPRRRGVLNTLVETQLERPRGGPLNHVWLRLSDGRALDP